MPGTLSPPAPTLSTHHTTPCPLLQLPPHAALAPRWRLTVGARALVYRWTRWRRRLGAANVPAPWFVPGAPYTGTARGAYLPSQMQQGGGA